MSPLSLLSKIEGMSPREFLSYVLDDLTLDECQLVMKDERQRRKSFLVNWPHDNVLSGAKMAQAGFYCIDYYDRVQCVFCLGSLNKWEAEDNPMTEHAKYFPFCRFIQGLECGNKEYKNDLLLADELNNLDREDETTEPSGELPKDSADLEDGEEQNAMQSNETESSLPATSVNELVNGERWNVLLESGENLLNPPILSGGVAEPSQNNLSTDADEHEFQATQFQLPNIPPLDDYTVNLNHDENVKLNSCEADKIKGITKDIDIPFQDTVVESKHSATVNDVQPDSVLMQELELAKLRIAELEAELAAKRKVVSLERVEVSPTTSDGTHNKDIAGTHKSLVNALEDGDELEHNSSPHSTDDGVEPEQIPSAHSVEDGDEQQYNSSSHSVEDGDEPEKIPSAHSVEDGDEPEHNSSSRSAKDGDEPQQMPSAYTAEDGEEPEHNSSSRSAKDGDEPEEIPSAYSVEDGDEPEHNSFSHCVEGGDEPKHNSSSQSTKDGDEPEQIPSAHSVEDGDEPEHNPSSHSAKDGDEPEQIPSAHSVEDGDEPEHNSSSRSAKDEDEPEQIPSAHSAEDGDEPEHNSSSRSAKDGDEPEEIPSTHSLEDGDEPGRNSSSHSVEDGDEPEHNSSSHSAKDGDEPEQIPSAHSVENGDEPEYNSSSHSVEDGDEPEHNSSSHSAKDGDEQKQIPSAHSEEDGDEPEDNSSSRSAKDGDEPEQNPSSHFAEDGDEPEHNSSSPSAEDGDEPGRNSSSYSAEDGDEPESNSSSYSVEDENCRIFSSTADEESLHLMNIKKDINMTVKEVTQNIDIVNTENIDLSLSDSILFKPDVEPALCDVEVKVNEQPKAKDMRDQISVLKQKLTDKLKNVDREAQMAAIRDILGGLICVHPSDAAAATQQDVNCTQQSDLSVTTDAVEEVGAEMDNVSDEDQIHP